MRHFSADIIEVRTRIKRLRESQTKSSDAIACLNYIQTLKQRQTAYASLLIQQLLRAILGEAPETSGSLSDIDQYTKTMLREEADTLFAIYGRTLLRIDTPAPDEVVLLTLFLNYMTRLLVSGVSPLFTLQASERACLRHVASIVEQWLDELIDLLCLKVSFSGSEQIEKIRAYVAAFYEKIQSQSDFLIFPSGFSQVRSQQLQGLALQGHLGSAYNQKQFSAGAAIITIDPSNGGSRQWAHMDPVSDYHERTENFKKNQRRISLNIDDIAIENITPLILEDIIVLRLFAPEKPYHSGYLYETVLAKLNGKTRLKEERDDFFKTSRDNTFCRSWDVIKDVFYYLLGAVLAQNPLESRQLYKKMISDFQLYLLQQAHPIYTEKKQYRHLLEEMCLKIASDAEKLSAIQKAYVVAEIEQVQTSLKLRQQCELEALKRERTWTELYEQPENFASISPLSLQQLRDKAFIQTQMQQSSLTGDVPRRHARFPVFEISPVQLSNEQIFSQFQQLKQSIDDFLQDPKLTYNINQCYQIALAIESAIQSALSHGVQDWYRGNAQQTEVLAQSLLTLGQLYYSCMCRVMYEYQRHEAQYPACYAKLTILMHAIYAMLDVLARSDAQIGAALADYKLNTCFLLNEDLRFERLSDQFILPNKSWGRLLSALIMYFEHQKTRPLALFYHNNIHKNLSYYYISFSHDADQKDYHIQCATTILALYPSNHESFQRDFKHLKQEQLGEKWAALFFGNSSAKKEYLPAVFSCLRDMAYYAQISLVGINSIAQMHSIVKKNIESNYTPLSKYTSPSVKLLASGNTGRGYCFIRSQLYHFTKIGISERTFPIRYIFSEKQEKFRQMVYPTIPETSALLEHMARSVENYHLASYRHKPDFLSKTQYVTLSFIRANLHTKLSRLYLALSHHDLSLEVEEHAYLVKQTLFEVSRMVQENSESAALRSFLEYRLLDQHFADIFVGLFTRIALELQQKISQHGALGHAIEILIFLHSFSPAVTKQAIIACFKQLRSIFIENIKKEKHAPAVSANCLNIWHAYLILSYAIQNELTVQDVAFLVSSRMLIEQNARLRVFLPVEIYLQVMDVFLRLEKNMEKLIHLNPIILNELSSALWRKLDDGTHLYQHAGYVADIVSGRLYKNKVRVGGLTKDFYQNQDYRAVLGEEFLLVEVDYLVVNNQKKLIRFSSKTPKKQFNQLFSHRITLLNSNSNAIWIEEKQDDGLYQTFVPHRYLTDLLPKFLLDGYTHWWCENQIFIKNKERGVEFRMNLSDASIFSLKHENQRVLPFHVCNANQHLYDKALWKVLSAFEDSHYILILADDSRSTRMASIHFPRFHLSFTHRDGLMVSNEYQSHYLASCQQIDTLPGISAYLVIEDVSGKNVNIQRKIIIGNRQASAENSGFRVTDFQLDLLFLPMDQTHFTYQIDTKIGSLQAETIAGKLYLAWLFFKTACLSRDDFTQMNAYEAASTILDLCWKNVPYTPIELDVILHFLSIDQHQLRAWKESFKAKEAVPAESDIASDVAKFMINIKDHHRNASAIVLNVIFLLYQSVEMQFLHKKDESYAESQSNKNEMHYYFFYYGEACFKYYLSIKNRIHEKCQLSLEEERKILHALSGKSASSKGLVEYYGALEKYLFPEEGHGSLTQTHEAKRTNHNYNHLFLRFSEKNQLKKENFNIGIKKLLSEKYGSTLYVLKNFPMINHIGEAVNFAESLVDKARASNLENIFDPEYFISLYEQALSGNTRVDKFESILNVLALQEKGSGAFLLLKILYMVVHAPDVFRRIAKPAINTNQSFYFSPGYFTINQHVFSSMMGNATENQPINPVLYAVFKSTCLRSDGLIKFSMEELKNTDVENQLSSLLMEGLRQNSALSNSMPIAERMLNAGKLKLKNKMLEVLMNQLLFDFLTEIAATCDQLKLSPAMGRSIVPANEPSFLYIYPVTLKRSALCLSPHDLLQTTPCFDGMPSLANLVLADWFEVKETRPSQQLFPLEVSNERSSLYESFFQNFGESFIGELKESYDLYKNSTIKQYRLLRSQSMQHLKEMLLMSAGEYRNQNQDIWMSIDALFRYTPNTENGLIFSLLRYSGQVVFSAKKDILSILAVHADQEAVSVIANQNPFIVHQSAIILNLITRYLMGETQRMKMERVISLIEQYEHLQDVDERNLIEQDIARTLAHQRRYPEQDYRSWLLFEFENNLSIRDNQYELTEKMVNGVNDYGRSTIGELYQLNMGEGKTSVILILLAQALADGQQLVRINVLEPLMGMLSDLLSIKLGGLIHKRVYHMPFSRDVETSLVNLKKILSILEECKKNRCLVLTTPEHRLCFQLKYQEKLLEYIEFKEADNTFIWDKYEKHYFSYYTYRKYSSTYLYGSSFSNTNFFDFLSKEKMREILIKAGYIDQDNKIKKFSDWDRFFKEITAARETLKIAYQAGAYGAYEVLKTQAISRKEEVHAQLNYLEKINKVAFCDILDESDEILRHGSELNYTLGTPQPLDGQSFRWKLPIFLLKILFLNRNISTCLEEAAHNGHVIFNPRWKSQGGLGGGVPSLRFMNRDFFDTTLKPLLADQLLKDLKKELQIIRNDFFIKPVYGTYSYRDFVLDNIEAMDQNAEKKILETIIQQKNPIDGLLPVMLLAKAWLSHQLLFHVMSRRYCVDYGLLIQSNGLIKNDMAIPYKGMNAPSPRSEFSHPDVMIGLTILSYYYEGLHEKQVLQALFNLKMKPERNKLLQQWYSWSKSWIEEDAARHGTVAPDWLLSFKTLDLESREHILTASRCFGRNPDFINYFLSSILFPEKAKYYERKITGNAHTLAGETNTTGFSGTDDRKDTMPATVKSCSLDTQKGTNGQMIHLITRPANLTYRSVPESSVEDFLMQVAEYSLGNQVGQENCYALIDAGAMATGMNNQEVAEFLLTRLARSFKGVVFFDDHSGEVLVLIQHETNTKAIPLATCHLSKKELFVYFDDVHTRGSDLKLPLTARGIVTLCQGMNKDKLMQAIMRLRQLDSKQSVCFWGSETISFNIARLTGVENSRLTSREVLFWITYNTIQKISGDLYPVTIKKFEYIIKRRALLYQEKNSQVPIQALIKHCAEHIPDDLVKLYGSTPVLHNNITAKLGTESSHLCSTFSDELEREIQARKIAFSIDKKNRKKDVNGDGKKMSEIIGDVDSKLPDAIRLATSLEADQEKEKEMEQEKIVETVLIDNRIAKNENKWDYSLVFNPQFVEEHRDSQGNLNLNSPKLFSLTECFRSVDYLKHELPHIKWHASIFATYNFIQTVSIDQQQNQDEYLRPCDVILVHKKNQRKETFFILLSGYEASEILALFYSRPEEDEVFLAHVNDVDDYMVVPFGKGKKVFKTDEEKYMRTVLKLFNGESHFKSDEYKYLERALGMVTLSAFINNSTIIHNKSEEIYHMLLSHSMLQKSGFFSMDLIDQLHQNSLDIEEKFSRHKAEIIQRLIALQRASIMDTQTLEAKMMLVKIAILMEGVVMLRDKIKCFQASVLEKKLGKSSQFFAPTLSEDDIFTDSFKTTVHTLFQHGCRFSLSENVAAREVSIRWSSSPGDGDIQSVFARTKSEFSQMMSSCSEGVEVRYEENQAFVQGSSFFVLKMKNELRDIASNFANAGEETKGEVCLIS